MRRSGSTITSSLLALLAFALAGSAAMLPAAAGEVPPDGYPSWEDVREARESEAGTAAEIEKITGLLSALQAEAESLGSAAVASAAEYAVADAALKSATARADTLSLQADEANAELARHRKAIGALAAQSYKTGGTTMGFFVALDALESNSIDGLNVVQIVGDKTADLVGKAAAAGKASLSLAAQEKAAVAERERLAQESRTKLDAARAAQEAMTRQIGEGQRRSGELTAQLASLKGTTAAVEEEYRQGQAAVAAYEAAQEAKRAAAEEQARRQAAAAANLPAAANPAPANPVPANPAPANPANPAPAAPAPTPADPPAPPPVVVPSVPGGAVNDPAGQKLRFRPAGSLRLGAGPVPVPRPALDQGIQLADHRHEPLLGCLRDPAGAAARQIHQRRQRLAHQLPHAD